MAAKTIKTTTLNGKTVALDLALKGVSSDKLTMSKDGVFTLRVGFFYTHGRTSEKLAAEIVAAVPGTEVIEHHEAWNAWPKDSYWEVKFRLPADYTLSDETVTRWNTYSE